MGYFGNKKEGDRAIVPRFGFGLFLRSRDDDALICLMHPTSDGGRRRWDPRISIEPGLCVSGHLGGDFGGKIGFFDFDAVSKDKTGEATDLNVFTQGRHLLGD